MVLHPLLGPCLPQKMPQFFFSSAHLLHPLIPRVCDVSLWKTSFCLVLGFPTSLVLCNFPLKTFFGILSSSILIIWPTHLSLLILISFSTFRYLSYKFLPSRTPVLGHTFFLIFFFQLYIAFVLSFVLGSKQHNTGLISVLYKLRCSSNQNHLCLMQGCISWRV